jgi:hypothetical protein
MVILENAVTVYNQGDITHCGNPRKGGTLKLLGNGKLTAEFDADGETGS